MPDIFATETRVHSALPVHCDTHLYVGQPVVISDRETGLFGEPGVISHVGYDRFLGKVIRIAMTNRLTEGWFSRTEFRVLPT